MPAACFEFDDILRPLLSPAPRNNRISTQFSGPQTAKHLIETLRIPHTEVLRITCAGRDIALSHLVQDGDVLLVRGIVSESRSEEPTFLLDGHLGRLAAGLRMLGLDCAYGHQTSDPDMVRMAVGQKRVLVTRDRRLLMRKAVQNGYLVRSQNPEEQLHEVCVRFALLGWFQPFRRCIRCNGVLESAAKASILDRLLPLTRLYYEEFRICPNCLQPYWEGSHMAAMKGRFHRLADHLRSSHTTVAIADGPATGQPSGSDKSAML